ncbi:hypothetical protein AB1K91_01985 [Terribacillus sp. 179-K 1B1 HS]|uniref:hypothetical protein n=1 Tax=Terribacillus sp. 179-K 1B1 HS TaxID=3142388 RepID=UPI0039A0ACED
MKKSKILTLHIILAALAIAGVIGIAAEAKSLYTLVHSHQEEKKAVTVEGKTISSDLFGNMYYYAVLKAGEESKVTHLTADGALTEVTREEFDQLDIGDTIEIAKSDSAENKAYRSEIYKSIFFIVIYAIVLIHYISFLVACKRRIEGWEWLVWPIAYTIQLLFFGVLAAILIYGYSSIGKMVYNAAQSYAGTQHETEAIITDKDEDINGGRYETNYHYIAFMYKDADGNTIHMSKEVRPSVYNDSVITTTISFPEDEPYRVHTNGLTLSDIIFYGTKLVPEFITIFLTGMLILIIRYMFRNYDTWKQRRKKKKQSREQSKRDRKKHRLKKKNRRRYEKSRSKRAE